VKLQISSANQLIISSSNCHCQLSIVHSLSLSTKIFDSKILLPIYGCIIFNIKKLGQPDKFIFRLTIISLYQFLWRYNHITFLLIVNYQLIKTLARQGININRKTIRSDGIVVRRTSTISHLIYVNSLRENNNLLFIFLFFSSIFIRLYDGVSFSASPLFVGNIIISACTPKLSGILYCLNSFLGIIRFIARMIYISMSDFVWYIALSGRTFCGFVYFPKALPLGYYILGFQSYEQESVKLFQDETINFWSSLSIVNCQLSID